MGVATTDWPQLVARYDVLARVCPSPVVELNRAVAVAMRTGRRPAWRRWTRWRLTRWRLTR
jgi:predicted RNA polymerase sigma factor